MAGNHQWKFVPAGWDPKAQQKNEKKQVQHLELHWSWDLFENCLEFDLIINSYFESLKGRWDFRGCAVCYSLIFMLSSKKENAELE